MQLRWRDLIETVGIASLIASLVFVGYQIQQDRDIARSQLGSETFVMLDSIYEARYDPLLAAVYVKMLDSPEELTTVEAFQINSHLQAIAQILFRECYLTRRGVFTECEELILSHIPLYFGNAYAQIWWEGSLMKSFLPEWVDEEISKIDPDTESQRIRGILQRLK